MCERARAGGIDAASRFVLSGVEIHHETLAGID